MARVRLQVLMKLALRVLPPRHLVVKPKTSNTFLVTIKKSTIVEGGRHALAIAEALRQNLGAMSAHIETSRFIKHDQ
ncbi:TPA: hypothetical protein I7730_00330 [Vibrio vulnificus]|uniref:Uncharacterized protein n=1 Tax=Vibrio vulnificus TaxID=672 RepID=A0A8H9MZ40_VIBVL|nr:hypothetical protein [Vibrio vulnificus]